MKNLFSAIFALALLASWPASAQMEPGQAPSASATAAAPAAKVTKTVERTTTKTYTVTKRKVGHVGGRPYPARTETVDGGITVEKFVNDTKTETQVVRPDPMLDQKPSETAGRKPYQYPFREYYTDDKGLQALGQMPENVDVRHTGNFND